MKIPQSLLVLAVSVSLAGLASAQQTDSTTSRRVQRSEDLAMCGLIASVVPELPANLKNSSGKVAMKIVIDTQGRVAQADAIAGPPMLVGPTIDSVKQWRFLPPKQNNAPVELETTATVEFSPNNPSVIMPKCSVRVTREVLERNMISTPSPQYPDVAKANHIQGDVVLEVTISPNGDVDDVRLVSGHPVLGDAAMKAVRQWKYKPYLVNGRPAEVKSSTLVRFHL